MKIEVPGRFRWLVKTIGVLVPVVGLVVSLLTLPPLAALAVAAALSLLSWFAGRAVFRFGAVLVMAMPTDAMEQFWFGTAWKFDPETCKNPTLCLVYLNRAAAQDAYRMLRTWSLGRQVDNEGHIRASIVAEGECKYSFYIMPGRRQPVLDNVEAEALETAGPRSTIRMSVIHAYLRNCADYSERPEMERIMEALPYQEYLQVEAAYIEGNEVVSYSKKPFRIKHFRVVDRAELSENSVEGTLEWEDLRSKVPGYFEDVANRVECQENA